MTKRVMDTERSREPVAGENRCKYAFMKITFELQGRNQDSVGCDVFFALGRTVLTANMAGRMRKQVVNELIRSLVLFTKGGAFLSHSGAEEDAVYTARRRRSILQLRCFLMRRSHSELA